MDDLSRCAGIGRNPLVIRNLKENQERTGMCPECGHDAPLNKEGLIWHHNRTKYAGTYSDGYGS